MMSTISKIASRVALVLATAVAAGVVVNATASAAGVTPPPPIVKSNGLGDRALPAVSFSLVGPDGKIQKDAQGRVRTVTIEPGSLPPPPKNR